MESGPVARTRKIAIPAMSSSEDEVMMTFASHCELLVKFMRA
jgi:hypothetical protein